MSALGVSPLGVKSSMQMPVKDAGYHAVLSAYLSIMAGLTELMMSLWAGHSEKSMSIYGIGIMAFVDVAGSVLVLSLWQCGPLSSPGGVRTIVDRRREMLFSAIIGTMMVFLGLFLIVDSMQRLVHKSTMDSSILGIVDSVVGTMCGFSLAGYKYVVGTALDSPVIIADSMSSLCGGLISFLALMVVFVDDELWWSDATAGFTSATYTFYAGVSTLFAANAELSKLNRLHRGGPRFAPEAVKKLNKAASDSQLYQQEVPQAAVDGPVDDVFEGEVRYDAGSMGIIKQLYRFLGLRDDRGDSRDASSIEKQKLLSLPSADSRDQGDDVAVTTFTA